MARSDFYKPRRAYEYDPAKKEILGRFYFIIQGEMCDGTKVWYKCDKTGANVDESQFYFVYRMAGHMIAICEGE